MNPVGVALFSIFIVAVIYLFIKLTAQRKLLIQLEQELQALASAWNLEHADLTKFISSKAGPVIAIEILNSVELAAKESSLGGLIGKYAPDMIRKKVVKHTAESLRDHMTQSGIHVEVKVYGID